MGIMERALSEYVIGGLKTTIPFMQTIINDENFRNGNITTTYIHDHPELLNYTDLAPENERLAKLVAEISAPRIQSVCFHWEHTVTNTPSLGSFKAILPEITHRPSVSLRRILVATVVHCLIMYVTAEKSILRIPQHAT